MSDVFGYATETGVVRISPVAGGAAFPSPLIMPPGTYSLNGNGWPMTAEGLYYIFHPVNGGGHRIVYQSDMNALMCAFAHLIRYGRTDEGLSAAQLTSAARERSVALRCGPAVAWVGSHLTALGVQWRSVHFMTAGVPNGFDDGHVAIEVKVGGNWRLYDVATNARFTNAGTPLSLAALFDVGLDTATTIDTAPMDSAPTPWAGGFSTEVYYNLLLKPEGAGAWRRRVYGIPGIMSGGTIKCYLPTGSAQEASNAALAGFQVLTKANWLASFYP